MDRISSFDLCDILNEIILSSQVAVYSEVDDSIPEITITLENGQVFNLQLKSVR